ncbi:MAG: metallopeptidase family protein [Alphaproteobacteria bacterium]|nr:metallopeptidase family protein [Alphaproteobacteria bacterium]
MRWHAVCAPTLEDFDTLAGDAFAALPARFRALCGDVVIRVEDFPDEEVLAAFEAETPFDISGLYQGTDLTSRSHSDPLPLPAMVFLYRRPILDEWSEGGVSLGALITHVLVHEIGHHFGLSDADMERIEAEARG